MTTPACSIDTCTRTVHARGWCRQHYMNWWRRGDPHAAPVARRGRPRPEARVPAARRFWSKVDLTKPDDCWPWAGSMRHEYGEFWLDGHHVYAHRMAAALVFGELDDEAVVLHTCDNPSCVRPDHLLVGTQAQNMADCSGKGRWKNQHAIGPGHPDRHRKEAS